MVPQQPRLSRGGFRSHRRWFLVPAALAALLFLSSCFTFGDESSWIRIQNMGGENASFSIQLFDEGGELITEHVCPSRQCSALAPGTGLTILLEGLSSYPAGVLGSAVVTSDQPLAVLMVSDVERDDGRFQSAGDTLSTVSSGGRLYLPLMTRAAGEQEDWFGRFVVQNMSSDVVACVSLVYISDDGGGVYWDPYDPARPPAQRRSGCPNGGFRIQPGASTFRDAVSLRPPLSFTGAVRVDLHTNAQGQPPAFQTVMASAGVWNANSMPFGSYRALSEAELGYAVLLPLIERDAFGFWTTQFQIQSLEPNVATTVILRIQGWDNSQDPPQFITKQNSVTVRGTRLCVQDDPGADCLAPGDDLPRHFSGYAQLFSSQPIGAIVSRRIWAQEWYSTYRGVAIQQAASKLYLPLVVKNAQSPERAGEHSAIRIQVAGGGDAEVTIRYRGEEISGGEAVTQVSVSGARTIVPDRSPLLPNGFVGSAVIESDQPIVVVAEVITGDFTGDTRIMYNGVPGP